MVAVYTQQFVEELAMSFYGNDEMSVPSLPVGVVAASWFLGPCAFHLCLPDQDHS